MTSINKVILIGNLTKDIEVKEVGENKAKLANFGLATSKSVKKKDGTWENVPSFHNVTYWSPTDFFVSNAKKGVSVFLEGEIEYQTYEKDGETKYITKIIAHRASINQKGESGGGSTSSSVDVPADGVSSADAILDDF